jgi:hypothetical protein
LSILDKKAINDLKWNYNYNLGRYINGCQYITKNKKECEKWLPEIISILENMNLLLEEIMKYEKVTNIQILKGFDIKEN